MTFAYSPALGLLSPTTLTGDLRAMLVMSNTTADTDEDAVFLDDIGTLDEYDGAGYARVALTTETFAVDGALDRFVLEADDITFAALSIGTRQAVGLLIFLHVTDATDSKPLFFYDGSGFPFDGNGAAMVFTPNSAGFMYTRNAV
jgi:hypothetical protein